MSQWVLLPLEVLKFSSKTKWKKHFYRKQKYPTLICSVVKWPDMYYKYIWFADVMMLNKWSVTTDKHSLYIAVKFMWILKQKNILR